MVRLAQPYNMRNTLVDGDGNFGHRDILVLRRYLAGWSVECDIAAADVDEDGSVGQRDVLILRRYLSGWDVVLGGDN